MANDLQKLITATENMTIKEIMNDYKSDYSKRGERLTIRTRTEYGTITIELRTYNSEKEHQKNLYPKIKEMKENGISQRDIASELEISESYVSQILKKKSKPM